MSYRKKYDEILTTGPKTAGNRLKPRNIYKLNRYGDKTEFRYIFVIGKVGDKLHCLKLNEIDPRKFTELLFDIYDKHSQVNKYQRISEITKEFGIDGKTLFEQHIKRNRGVYRKGLSSYHVYSVDKIKDVFDVYFEEGLLREILKIGSTETTRNIIVEDEIKEKDG